MPRDSHTWLVTSFGSYIQKMRESHLLLVSRSKALASPNKSKRNNAEAHA